MFFLAYFTPQEWKLPVRPQASGCCGGNKMSLRPCVPVGIALKVPDLCLTFCELRPRADLHAKLERPDFRTRL